jgi:hypothetical protein
MARRLACPACGTPITFAQALGSESLSFPCRRCGVKLSKRLRIALPGVIGSFALAWTASQYGVSWQFAVAIVGLIALLALIAILIGAVTRAPPEMMDAELARKLGLGQGSSSNSFDSDGGDGGD